jgi:RHS repeat-associated protein
VDENDEPRTMAVVYNNLDQPTRVTYSNGKYVDYTYDQAGRTALVEDDAGIVRVAYEYWPDGQVKTKVMGPADNPLQTLDYRYNARDWLLSINEGAVDLLPPGDGMALELSYTEGAYRGVEDSSGFEFPSGYYNGNVASYKLKLAPGTGATDSTVQLFAYDNLDRLQAEYFPDVSMPPGMRYTHDLNGNIRTADMIYCDQVYPLYDYVYYDGSNRLEQIVGLAEGDSNFVYTPSGSMSASRADHMTMSYDHQERLSQRRTPGAYAEDKPDICRYWYNTEGQRIAKSFTYHYRYPCGDDSVHPMFKTGGNGNSANQASPIEPTPRDRLPQSLASGHRLSELPDSWCYRPKTTYTGYYYLGDKMLSDYAGPHESDLLGNYVYANGERIARFKGDNPDEVAYYLTDHLGSVVRRIRGSDGAWLSKEMYRPYGIKLRSSIIEPDKYGYTAQELDDELAVDWYYFGSRYYDPRLRIFTSVDPLAANYPEWGSYAYALNNPIKHVDPDGEGVVASRQQREFAETYPVTYTLLLDPENAMPGPAAIKGPTKAASGPIARFFSRTIGKPLSQAARKVATTVRSFVKPGVKEGRLAPTERGLISEAKVLAEEGLQSNKKMMPGTDPKTGMPGKTMPDAVRPDGQLVEVKDVEYIADSKQLRVQNYVSTKQSGKPVQVIVGKATRVSGTVIDRYEVHYKSYLGPQLQQ